MPEVLTFGDHTLFPDTPALVPTRGLPAHQRYLGYVAWSPPVPLPEWWSRLDAGRPTAYVTLGSSGRVQLLPMVLDAAASLGCQVLVATAGRVRLGALPPHVFAADYLPGDLAARRAAVVISNGGSTTGYQALAEGRPVLGIPFNLDQSLASQAIARPGAGLVVRAGLADAKAVAAALSRLLAEPSFATKATDVAAGSRPFERARCVCRAGRSRGRVSVGTRPPRALTPGSLLITGGAGFIGSAYVRLARRRRPEHHRRCRCVDDGELLREPARHRELSRAPVRARRHSRRRRDAGVDATPCRRRGRQLRREPRQSQYRVGGAVFEHERRRHAHPARGGARGRCPSVRPDFDRRGLRNSDRRRVDEASPLAPRNPYAASKAAAKAS